MCALHCVFLPTASPTSPSGKTLRCVFFFFLWVGCQWCLQHISPEHRISVASAVGADDSSSPCGKKLYVKTWTFQWIKVSSFFSPPGIEMDYTCICKLLLTVCASEVATWFAAFSFYLYIPPNPSLPSSLHPLWSRCTVIPLPSHLLHPHAHLLSVSHKATFRSRERKLLMKRNRSFFNHTLRSHLLTLISSLSASHFACSIVLRWQMVY